MFSQKLVRKQRKSLIRAIKKNDVEAVRNIMSNNPKIADPVTEILTPEDVKNAPLWTAMHAGREETLELMITLGSDVNQKFTKIECSLELSYFHLFAYSERDYLLQSKSAEILLQHGADINANPESVAGTPLQIAISKGNLKFTEFLLENGARLKDGPEWELIQPLELVYEAPKDKQTEALQVLIKYGLDTEFVDADGNDCLLRTVKEAIYSPDEVDAVGIAKILLDSGVPINGADFTGMTTFISAVRSGSTELVSLLIEKGADINEIAGDMSFPLLVAAQIKNSEILELLISKGAKLDMTSHFGFTALHGACTVFRADAILLLTMNGANISAVDRCGNTPFYLTRPYKCDSRNYLSIFLMITEIAKLHFMKDPSVRKSDLDLVQAADPNVQEVFEGCMNELDQMSKKKFYSSYTYFFVLKMMNKETKLVNLCKNEEFVSGFRANMDELYYYYKDDIVRVFNKAVKLKDKSVSVEFNLKSMLGDTFPDVVMRKLAGNLTVEDLPVQLADT